MYGLSWREPELPVVQNVDAEVHDGLQSIRDALVRQLYLPVQWTGVVQALASTGIMRLGECGPGRCSPAWRAASTNPSTHAPSAPRGTSMPRWPSGNEFLPRMTRMTRTNADKALFIGVALSVFIRVIRGKKSF